MGIALNNATMNKKLSKFYASHFIPQYKVWSLKKISAVRDYEAIEIDGFMNY